MLGKDHHLRTAEDIPSSYRQGDILLVRCSDIPAGGREEPAEYGRVVLARGEITGHAHTLLADQICYFREDGSGTAYVQVTGPEPAELQHEEHTSLLIPPGTYRVVQQREYQPRSAPRTVID